MPAAIYKDILGQVQSGYAILFLGAGSTVACRRPDGMKGYTGNDLAAEILRDLNGGTDPGLKGISLTQASEFYASTQAAGRRGLDRLVKERLTNLQPTIGHFLAAAFPWRAVVTTNYNRVAEEAWSGAHAAGYASNDLIPIRTDADLIAANTRSTRFYKPHGCISIQPEATNRMVLTSTDFFESERLRPQIFNEIRSLARDCSTVFVGYSLNDHTFRNIFYSLYKELGQWAARSYSIGPLESPLYEEWLKESMQQNFRTTVVNETFDTFMLRLTLAHGKIHPELRKKVLSLWPNLVEDDANAKAKTLRDLTPNDIESLPDR